MNARLGIPPTASMRLAMTPLRQRMLHDMQIRNLAENTQHSYLIQVSCLARHFRRSPELLGPEEIRVWLVYLREERELAPASLGATISWRNDRRTAFSLPRDAQTRLERRGLSLAEEAGSTASHPQPGGDHHLLRVDRQSQAPHHPDDRVRRRTAGVRSRASEGHRYRQQAHGHPCEPGEEP
ncbi:hypothetical protein LMG29542_08246 [Paraburkholderia humisilvae]|uniref:Integrase SAM-like N-terminal domain-containing protein n=1 Tax=Paraburkholderia humisilvae TaxID=627669 RepID=A0A6J5F8P0_9BURK|nr:hypothetical protein LMG29542_08246 [Paraburkholderia humisilvae]